MSDIHWTRQLDSTDDYTDIREMMLEDLGYYCQATGNKFDKILICGDIAFSGSRVEYERANTFIADLCKKVNCKMMKCILYQEIMIKMSMHHQKR